MCIRDRPSAQLLQDRGELANFSFGQGAFTATPVQIAAFTGVFANGGTYISPTSVSYTHLCCQSSL